MTPGYAKTRDQLPWLYYPENDSVRIINAHNFGGGGGGAPTDGLVGAWIPSLDTAGNLTTTLTDLSGGGNNGTLTNMDAGSDWPSDTDSGGVRAVDFDGSDDQVVIGASYDLESGGSVSLWIYVRNTTTAQKIIACRSATSQWSWAISGGVVSWNWYDLSTYYAVSETITTGWHHIVGIHSGSNVVAAYLDGVAMTGSTAVVNQGSIQRTVLSGRTNVSTTQPFDGRQDAIRIYNRALTTDEIATLYDSGNGRGLA